MKRITITHDFQPQWKLQYRPCRRQSAPGSDTSAPVLVSDPGTVDIGRSGVVTVHELFESFYDSMKEPDRLALDYGEFKYSFSELERLANHIAQLLIRDGVRPGEPIGVLLDRSVYSYATILGVMKAGAAFVPLDKSFPADRIEFILQDCEAALILAVSAVADLLADITVRVKIIDTALGECDDLVVDRPSLSIEGESLAYIIYTSGSTGRPKGVPIKHASITNFLSVAAATYGYLETDRVYQGLTIAFDFSFEEIWLPLLVGATLVPAPSDVNLVADELADFLVDNCVTSLCCTPTLLATISKPLPLLRFIMVSGEACPKPLAQRWAGQGRRMLNTYGPTEATVTATWQVMSEKGTVSIGGPLPSYSIVILSPEESVALPPGEAGEIAIAGVGVADGYVNLPEKSESVFIEDFIGLPDNPGGKLYRTGDLGRINNDCTIEYLGRIDTQVKIRGYRIELEEIESVAMSVEGISQSVASAVELPGGGKELVLFVCASKKIEEKTLLILERVLRDRMPVYMVPSFIEQVDRFSMMTSGKIDRKSLPKPCLKRRSASNTDFHEPKPGLESGLANVLTQTLSLDKISSTDDFFDELGANSLSMAKFLAEAKRRFPLVDISLKDVYQSPTIENLAGRLNIKTQASTYAIGNSHETEKFKLPENNVSSFRYVMFTVVQIVIGLVLAFITTYAFVIGVHWVAEVETLKSKYLFAFMYTSLFLAGSIVFFLGLKWALMNKADETPIPLWTRRHLKLTIARWAIIANPLNAFTGLPLHAIYLRLIGMNVGKHTTLMCPAPAFPDLVSVGSNTLVRETAYVGGYTVSNGYILPGRIIIGDNCYIAPVNVLLPGSTIERDVQLGNNSCVYRDQVLAAGRNYQGSPAEPADTNFIKTDKMRFGAWRRWLYTLFGVVSGLTLAPLIFVLVDYLAPLSASLLPYLTASRLGWLLLSTVALYFVGILLACISVILVPRAIRYIQKTNKAAPLFGIQYIVNSWMSAFSNSKYLNRIFGDSSLIMHYFKAIGYGMNGVVQTGSNAGVEQKHSNPFLCSFGRNAMVADGLTMKNIEISNTSFKLGKVRIPEDTFLGNSIYYPIESRIGSNCLVATKAMVPIDGPVRTNTGILGSPPFEIPRSVERDQKFEQYKKPALLKERIRLKLMSNLRTLALYFFKSCTQLFVLSIFAVVLFMYLHAYPMVGAQTIGLLVAGITGMFFVIFYSILFEHISLGFKRLEPKYCSIYEEPFWDHERYWKMNTNPLIELFNGTALKPWFQRLRGLTVGKRVYDAGCSFPEPGLVSVGDDCNLNVQSIVQGHSMEDGVFKSDRVTIGERCTLGTGAFIHYGVKISDETTVLSDSFVMKGSSTAPGTVWGGNPARQRSVNVHDAGGVSELSRKVEQLPPETKSATAAG